MSGATETLIAVILAVVVSVAWGIAVQVWLR
jgi:hypothetical protein